jgi:uncharacterized protein YbjT (DUF2867 family)
MILVIGGTGQVGCEVVKQLAQAKAKARVLVRSAQKAEEAKKLGLETVEGDFTNIPSLEAALKGVEKLFLLTPAGSHQADQEIAVMEAAKKAGVKHIVLVSAVGAHPSSPITLAQQHAKSEDHLKGMGLAYTILQPHSFMQNLFRSLGSIKGQGAIYGNFKEGKIAMVDTRDIAAVAVAALTQPGHENQTYVITGPEAVTNSEVAEKLSALTGKKVNYVDIPSEQIVKAMTGMGVPDWMASDLSKLGEVFAAGYGSTTTDVVEKVAKKKPIKVEQFLKDYAQIFN